MKISDGRRPDFSSFLGDTGPQAETLMGPPIPEGFWPFEPGFRPREISGSLAQGTGGEPAGEAVRRAKGFRAMYGGERRISGGWMTAEGLQIDNEADSERRSGEEGSGGEGPRVKWQEETRSRGWIPNLRQEEHRRGIGSISRG
ncbi:hypothetical protein KM043_014980 [Ampulex compressa]|nr:hypothetical protein KM043_014980 [Ampulex compressa]